MSRQTILDILKHKANDGVIPIVDEATLAIPEIRVFAADPIKGTSYRTLIRKSLPTVTFRSANEGVTASKSAYENRRIEAYCINPRFETDEIVAMEHPQGVAGSLAEEGIAQTEAAWLQVARQLWIGQTNDAKGFPGFPDLVHSSLVTDVAGGTTAARSSVWGVKFGPTNCRFVLGHNGKFSLDDPRRETLYDADDKPFTGWVQEMLGFIGLQVASIYSVGRIKGLTQDSGKTLTDDVVATWLTKFPANKLPDALFMTKVQLEELRKSRTATNATGAPAPRPTECHGIPIHVSEAIPTGETV